jgi:hypothetical protein
LYVGGSIVLASQLVVSLGSSTTTEQYYRE